MMRTMFKPHSTQANSVEINPAPSNTSHEPIIIRQYSFADQVRYLSDSSSNEDSDDENAAICNADAEVDAGGSSGSGRRLPAVPPLKRRKLDVPVLIQREKSREKWLTAMLEALVDLNKVIQSKKTKFSGGPQGLQARRARAIAGHLFLVTKSGRSFTGAAEMAAESNGFAPKWGGRQLRGWTRRWVSRRELPQSLRGTHAKVYSLLDDLTIATELRAYLRSNKWAMNPEKLAQFSENKLIPSAADEYLRHIIKEEMPRGLKQYMEYELFPRIQLKVGRGISLSTASDWHG